MSDPLITNNPLAERRFAYAQAALREHDYQAARDVLEQTLELDPGWAAAWFALGEAEQQLEHPDAAAQAFAEALRLDPADRQGATVKLAALEGRAASALPPAYVQRLFDDYAPRFEAHLTEDLRYRGPQLLRDAVDALAPGRRFRRALDLGCGSGLAGRAFRALADALSGVDLSPAMVGQARRSGLYDRLEVADVVEFLRAEPPTGADLILAADVFVYLGDLAPVLAAAAATLAPEGLLAFTVEAFDGEGFALGKTLRFRHARTYLEEAIRRAGLQVLTLEEKSTRREADAEVAGYVIVATLSAPSK